MTQAALGANATGATAVRPSLDRATDPRTLVIFLGLLGAGLLFVAYSLYADVDASLHFSQPLADRGGNGAMRGRRVARRC